MIFTGVEWYINVLYVFTGIHIIALILGTLQIISNVLDEDFLNTLIGMGIIIYASFMIYFLLVIIGPLL